MVKLKIFLFHPKGQYLVGSDEYGIYIWDLQSIPYDHFLICLPKIKLSKKEIGKGKTIFSPCGNYLASIGRRDTVYFWETASWTCVYTIKASSSVVYDLVWSNKIDEAGILYLGTACYSGLKMWKLDSRGTSLKSQLVWRTDEGLHCNSIHLQKTTGLSEANYNLLKQYSLNTIKGRPSDKQSLDVIRERNEQKYISGGEIAFNSQNKHFKINQIHWIISLAKEKKPS